MKYLICFLICYAIILASIIISYTYFSGYIAGATIMSVTLVFRKLISEEGKKRMYSIKNGENFEIKTSVPKYLKVIK